FARDRSWLVASVHARSPNDVIEDAVAAALYPPGHPYRFDPDGDEQLISRMRRSEITGFLREQLRPDQIVVAAAGHVGWDELFGDVVAEFGNWSGQAPPAPSLPDVSPPPLDAPLVLLDRKGSNQSEVRIAALCPPFDSPDRLPFLLLDRKSVV